MSETYQFDRFRPDDVPAVVALWQECFPGRFLSGRGIALCTFDHPGFRPEGAFTARDGAGRPVGFALGADHRLAEIGAAELPGCVPVVMVAPGHRKRGLGGRLLAEAERFLAGRGHRVLRAGYPTYRQDTLFSLLGVNAAWLEAAWFFRHYGYAVTGAVDSASLSLDDFRLPARILELERRPAAAGVAPGRLEPGEAAPFLAFLAREFPETSWHRNFTRQVAERTLAWQDVFVLRRGCETVGFLGPFTVSESGTAAMGIGLGLAAACRGSGLGAILLYRGLEAMKQAGAHRCLLYGMGPRRYYEEAGFRLDNLWLVMKKELAGPPAA